MVWHTWSDIHGCLVALDVPQLSSLIGILHTSILNYYMNNIDSNNNILPKTSCNNITNDNYCYSWKTIQLLNVYIEPLSITFILNLCFCCLLSRVHVIVSAWASKTWKHHNNKQHLFCLDYFALISALISDAQSMSVLYNTVDFRNNPSYVPIKTMTVCCIYSLSCLTDVLYFFSSQFL